MKTSFISMKKLTKKDFEEIEKDVGNKYAKKEYQGVFESFLHLETQLGYLRSEEGKKVLTEQLGEIPYLEQIRLQERNLETRKAEVEFLRNSLK